MKRILLITSLLIASTSLSLGVYVHSDSTFSTENHTVYDNISKWGTGYKLSKTIITGAGTFTFDQYMTKSFKTQMTIQGINGVMTKKCHYSHNVKNPDNNPTHVELSCQNGEYQEIYFLSDHKGNQELSVFDFQDNTLLRMKFTKDKFGKQNFITDNPSLFSSRN